MLWRTPTHPFLAEPGTLQVLINLIKLIEQAREIRRFLDSVPQAKRASTLISVADSMSLLTPTHPFLAVRETLRVLVVSHSMMGILCFLGTVPQARSVTTPISAAS